MRLRIYHKEDLLHELCGRYGLELRYSWGTWCISGGSVSGSIYSSVSRFIVRTELHEMSADRIEETVLRYALLAGF